MFIPIWVIILAWLIVPALCYVFGAMMANTKTKREIIQEMTKAEAVDMLAKQVLQELRKRIDAAKAQKKEPGKG